MFIYTYLYVCKSILYVLDLYTNNYSIVYYIILYYIISARRTPAEARRPPSRSPAAALLQPLFSKAPKGNGIGATGSKNPRAY